MPSNGYLLENDGFGNFKNVSDEIAKDLKEVGMPILLGCYTFGCHSIRHFVGGNLDCFSCSAYHDKVSHNNWRIVTFLNRRHQLFAWLSLVWVGLSDVYVRLVSMGIINDYNTWGI